MKQLPKNSQVVRFATVGGLNTAIDFGILFTMRAVGLPEVGANLVSTTVSFVFSFVANKKYTFRTRDTDVKREMMLFVVVTLFGLWVLQSIIIALVSPALIPLGLNDATRLLIAKVIATIVSLVWNYVLYSRLVFAKKGAE